MQSVPLHRSANETVPRDQVFRDTGSAIWKIYEALPDMVNGNASTFSFIFVSAGLPAPYHWVPDAHFGPIPAATTEDILRTRICVEATFHTVMLAESGMDIGKARVASVILATARVAGRRVWGFRDEDTVATQRMVVPALVALNADGSMTTDVAGWATQLEWGKHLDACISIYDDHMNDLLAKIQQVSIGMPSCNGVIIVRTMTHHYVDPHKKICNSVVDQYMGQNPVIPQAITKDEFMDLMCHKAFHVIDSPKLVWMARSQGIKGRLKACGQGAAAVRIPAEFDVERAAGSLHALVVRMNGGGAQSNVVISLTTSETLISAVTSILSTSPGQDGMRQAEEMVETYRTNNGWDLGFSAGYLTAMFDFTNAVKRTRSVLEGYSVKKLKDEQGEAWAAGMEHYDVSRKWRKARAVEGHLAGYGLMGAARPADFAPPKQVN